MVSMNLAREWLCTKKSYSFMSHEAKLNGTRSFRKFTSDFMFGGNLWKTNHLRTEDYWTIYNYQTPIDELLASISSV